MYVLEQLVRQGLVIDSHRSDCQVTLGFTIAGEVIGFEFRDHLFPGFSSTWELGHSHALFPLLGYTLRQVQC